MGIMGLLKGIQSKLTLFITDKGTRVFEGSEIGKSVKIAVYPMYTGAPSSPKSEEGMMAVEGREDGE